MRERSKGCKLGDCHSPSLQPLLLSLIVSTNLSQICPENIFPDFFLFPMWVNFHMLQLELLPQKVVLQAEGVGGLGGLQVDGLGGLHVDGGDEEEEEERHPHSD